MLNTLTVEEAKQVARDWVYSDAIRLPGFWGAFYHGSITWLKDDDTLPPASDIDIVIVLADAIPADRSSGKLSFRDQTLEVTYSLLEEFQSSEQVLGRFYWAGSFRFPNIIADTRGHLTRLQREVAGNFAARYWVRQRRGDAADRALEYLDQLDARAPLHDQVLSWLFARGLMVHMLLVAGLRNPTVRKRYVEVEKVLTTFGLPDFYEKLLESVRFAGLTRAAVERHLVALTGAFNAASSVARTPYRFAQDISPAGWPVAIDGSRELIEAGHHREAMFWIVATYCRCMHILSLDASPGMRQLHSEGLQRIMEELGIGSYHDREMSNRAARVFFNEVWRVSEVIITRNPDSV